MHPNKIKQLVIKEYDSPDAQKSYNKIIEEGLFASEKHFIGKYFKKKGKVLDIGCGTGRASIPLQKMRHNVVGIDIVPSMIENAKKISKKIKYEVGDATQLKFKDNSFNSAIFTYQGWTKIPGRENRRKAITETYRVLKKDGIFILTMRRRVWAGRKFPFWLWRWIRFFVLKRLGFRIWEEDFGDVRWKNKSFVKWVKTFILKPMGFEIEGNYGRYGADQYYHTASLKEVGMELRRAGFKILEVNNKFERLPNQKSNIYSPYFWVCLKGNNLVDSIANKSKFTQKDVDELSKLVKKGIAKNHQ